MLLLKVNLTFFLIKIGKFEYKLYLIDTCVISEILKNKEEIGKKIVPKFIENRMMFCYTIQTIGELRKAPDIYDQLFNYMRVMPTIILKNYNQLTDDELKFYPVKNTEEPILIFVHNCKDSIYYNKLKDTFESDQLKKFFNEENLDVKSTLESLLNWKDGYKPAKGKYTKKEIEIWVELITLKQIAIKYPEFCRNYISGTQKGIQYKNFLSWNMIAYTTFYKFYISKRNPIESDVNDILNMSALPYLDGIITEKNLCEQLRQIKNHEIIENLELFTIKSFLTQ